MKKISEFMDEGR